MLWDETRSKQMRFLSEWNAVEDREGWGKPKVGEKKEESDIKK